MALAPCNKASLFSKQAESRAGLFNLPSKPQAWTVTNDSPTSQRGPGQAPVQRLLGELHENHLYRISRKELWVGAAVSVHRVGVGEAKKTQRYNPELPILQGPALHILIKHVSHVIELVPGDGDSCGREQLLAGAGTKGGIRGRSERLAVKLDPGTPSGQGQPLLATVGPGGKALGGGGQEPKVRQQRGSYGGQGHKRPSCLCDMHARG